MRIIIAVALGAALAGCGQQGANKAGNASANTVGNGATANVAAPAMPAEAAAWGEASAPAAAYKSYFDARWEGRRQPVTPAEVQAMLANQTPQQVVNALWGNGDATRWGTVSRGIAMGDPAWLAVAVPLSRGTDAGTSDDFAIAAGDALTTNPTGALRLLSQIEMGAGACSENGFEVPDEQARAFYTAAIASVERVSDRALAQIKGECLTALRAGMAGPGGAAPKG